MYVKEAFPVDSSASSPPTPGSIQTGLVQVVVGPDGNIQEIPIHFTTQQLSMIRRHMTGGPSLKPILHKVFHQYHT